jgi:REP element-mobilizing transposase RayT
MSEKYKIGESFRPHFITMTVLDWVDLFTRPVYKNIIIDSFNYCINQKGLVLYAYCIMPSHVHIIASSTDYPLNGIIRDFKKFTCKRLIEVVESKEESRREWLIRKFEYAARRVEKGVNHKIWKDGFHPIELISNKMMVQKLEYLHQNPVEEAYVRHAEDWVYSSARFYSGQPDEKIALKMLG